MVLTGEQIVDVILAVFRWWSIIIDTL